MSEKKSKEKRKEKATPIFEVTIKTFSDKTVSVSSNDDRALDNPVIYTSIINAMNHSVIGRWIDKQERIAKERHMSRILKPGDLN